MRLELVNITKRFGSFVANDNINLVVEPGEIHALLGENGAGKSTLMNVLYGIYRPDGGEILLDDEPVYFSSAGDAVAAGIGMVHQHFMLVPVFTVAESVALGYEPVSGPGRLLDFRAARRKVREVSERFGFDLDPDAYIEDLPVGVQQRVEIVKALSRDASILVLDEPTAVLTPQETDELMDIMRQLASEGTSIIFITHKLREVRAVADKITVIRRGQVVGEAQASSSESELATMMVGRPVMLKVDKRPAQPTDGGLELRGVSLLSPTGNTLLDDVNLDVRPGEIVAVAGVQGNGQTELAEVLLGLESPNEGKVLLDDRDLTKANVRQHLKADVGFVPEDRSTDGMIGSFSIAENLITDQYHDKQFATGPFMKPRAIAENAAKRVQEFDIRVGSVTDAISTLSGGNQQKVVVARELSQDLRLLVANQPTRGVDVGSIEFIHQRIVAARDAGVPVLVVSSELDEVYALADRIAVMYRGRIVAVVPPDTPRDVMGLLMAGVPEEEAMATGAKEGAK
ncbi:ABC transporter ATP-binding protein [Actinobaculum sp. 352]|uniref:ABC transporter ATP-binding protein n=1 Tax=Actinobaculum sp. 352 TaxID=2490946 RepID=UPI000F7E40A9|nr:ABC transporter ATP-binding protein [Actinobaculum sp. 352]RTE50970.1 ABC transporter ATP-binding protein [Actinobaculum sp. 352]